MVESNYDILNLPDGATPKEIREAFRILVLQHHSDKGGDDTEFKKIKQAYEDLKLGKRLPDSVDTKHENSKVYSGEDEQEKLRRNMILSNDVAYEMKHAQEWAAALNRANGIGVRLFGSKELGQIEFERKANQSLSIKGKYWAGRLTYDNPIFMWGSVTSPYFSRDDANKTVITVTKGNFVLIDAIKNRFDIDGGAKIISNFGDIVVGDVSGKRVKVPDPLGRVGMTTTVEFFTELIAPKGKIVAGNVHETVKLDADTIIVLNVVDNVNISGRDILVYGSKVSYDVNFFLKKGGKIRFFDPGSGYDISDDATLTLESGISFKLRDLKTSQLISAGGKEITYDYLEQRNTKSSKSWSSKFGF